MGRFFKSFCRLEMLFPEAELDLARCGFAAGSLDITSCKDCMSAKLHIF